jgi:hypothetical protein
MTIYNHIVQKIRSSADKINERINSRILAQPKAANHESSVAIRDDNQTHESSAQAQPEMIDAANQYETEWLMQKLVVPLDPAGVLRARPAEIESDKHTEQ